MSAAGKHEYMGELPDSCGTLPCETPPRLSVAPMMDWT